MQVYTYQQSKGLIWSPEGQLMGYGYSGHKEGKNNGALESLPFVGPIPCGLWTINGHYDSPSLGKKCLILMPKNHKAHDRTEFRIHGDSRKDPGNASKGCIVMANDIRSHIIERLNDFQIYLTVIA